MGSAEETRSAVIPVGERPSDPLAGSTWGWPEDSSEGPGDSREAASEAGSGSEAASGAAGSTPWRVDDRVLLDGRPAQITDIAHLGPGHDQIVLRWLDDPRALPLSVPSTDLVEVEELPGGGAGRGH